MYSAMQKGWNKEDIQDTIARLNNVDKNLEIFIYRGEKVSSLFGELKEDKIARETIPSIKNAFEGKETLDIVDSNSYNFV